MQDQAVRAALQILSTQGYSGTTLHDIAAEVGLTRPGLLHHFGSRDGLLVEILRRRDVVNTSYSAGKKISRLDATIATARRNARVPGLVALYSSMCGLASAEPKDSATNMFFAERFAALRTEIADSIRHDQLAGHIVNTVDAKDLASIFIAASDGLQVQWLLDPEIDIPSRLEDLVSLYRTV
ncbi:TetR/AcrR family transcriptional regulator [Microbacterium sp. GXF0217]